MGLKELIEAWKGEDVKELLLRLYIDQDLSIRDVAKELKISSSIVHKWLKDYGISKNNDLF